MTAVAEKSRPRGPVAAEHYYPAAAFAQLAELEAESFWFQSRNQILLSTLRRFAPGSGLRYAEIGCGTGFVLAAVAARFPAWSVHGYDIHAEAVAFSRQRAARATVERADLHDLPPGAPFDLIGVFDVLEHLDDDVGALRSLRDRLRPGGHLVLTVPQHPCLWSPYDEAARHRRRYQRTEMHQRLLQAGYKVQYVSSFVTTLWPVLWWRRRALRNLTPDHAAKLTQTDLTPSPVLNLLGRVAMWPDVMAARLGLPLWWGGSLLAVAERS